MVRILFPPAERVCKLSVPREHQPAREDQARETFRAGRDNPEGTRPIEARDRCGWLLASTSTYSREACAA